MRIGVPKETFPGERRVALVPSLIAQLKKAGMEVGIEAGAGVLVTRQLSFQAAYTLADYTFTDYILVNGAVSDTLTGNRLSGVPRHFLRAGVRAGPFAGFTIDADQVLSSSLFADDLNTIEVADWGAGVTNLRATWTDARDRYQIIAYGRNITDEYGLDGVTAERDADGTIFQTWSLTPPRTYGVEVQYRFGR